MATRRILILTSVMLIVMRVCASAQSGPLDADLTNDGTTPLKSTWGNQNFKLVRSEATAGMADPGPALGHSAVAADTLNGHGLGCSPLSPCAAISPALDHNPMPSPVKGSVPRFSRHAKPGIHKIASVS
jgi:hypothetical protein